MSHKHLSDRSNGPGLRHLGVQGAMLAATGTLCLIVDGPLLAGVMLAHGVLLVFLFPPLHECVHRTAFRTAWINKSVADLCGFLLLLPPRWFAAFHMAHHRFTQDPGRDPELASPKPTTLAGYLYLLSGVEYWHRMVRGLVGRALGHAPGAFLDERSRTRSIVEARIYLGLYIALGTVSALTDPWPVLVLWVGPALLGQPFLRAYLLSEHWGCPSVKDMWANTRSVVSVWPIRWLAWNMPYHAEHHANPGIPFHALPAYAEAMRGSRKVEAAGYAPFHAERIVALRNGTAEPL
ncbi:MAG: fatty acid desaturase [Alphaproteobacteria bacterium]|nr:fatty acid desaturase [Alphaproteobacteria bacterium]